jgi:hypothetical protein
MNKAYCIGGRQLAAMIDSCCIFTLAILSWCLLADVPLTAKAIGLIFVFCIGVVSWSSI